VEKTNRTWETVCHLSPLVLLLGIPMTNVLAPLIVWFIVKQQSAGADQHGRAVLNFQLSMTLYFAVLYLAKVIPYMEQPGAVCLRAWVYINIFFILRATFTATQGELFKFPFSIRFIPE
jgi:uncharacterized Tic20 family protein